MLGASADYTDRDSLAYRLRRRRFGRFLQLLDQLPRPVRILDVGGTETFWQMMGVDELEAVSITLLNVFENETTSPHIHALTGDGCDLSQFADGEFDVVFSNSVIEHVRTWENQRRMAAEIRRVGRSYFVQTPNRYFPVEPHFQYPCFQFLPRWWKIRLLKSRSVGWYPQAENDEQAGMWADEIRLLTRREIRRLFPEAELIAERYWCLAKSYMAIHVEPSLVDAPRNAASASSAETVLA
ncbi:MAG: class I SAM-dependent methyltransferase [Pirellulaceae bacterium]